MDYLFRAKDQRQMPLEGIRVLDWTIGQFGPATSMMLGDLGADVIKIEQPVVGDYPARGIQTIQGISVWSPLGLSGERNYYFEINNRNKRGITLDLKKDEGKRVLYKLVKRADVFVHNFRKPVVRRSGMDYETLSQYNPQLVYAEASTFGREGPSFCAGFDIGEAEKKTSNKKYRGDASAILFDEASTQYHGGIQKLARLLWEWLYFLSHRSMDVL